MDTKHQTLEKKVLIFIQKLEAHKPSCEAVKKIQEFLREDASSVLEAIKLNKLRPSGGNGFGWSRGLSDVPELDDAYDAGYDAESYYRHECVTWEDTPKKTESEDGGFSVA